VQTIKRVIGHIHPPSAFDVALIATLAGMALVGLFLRG
jgi:hypothetical protein